MQLNLNADLGESFGQWSMGDDANLLQAVDSANIACGFHAGDPLVISQTLTLCKQQSVSVGAHPGFPDLQGFGRRQMQLSDNEVHATMLYQIAALRGMAQSQNLQMTHVKPHGAINNMACEDRALADVIVSAVQQIDPAIVLLAPVMSQLESAAQSAGLKIAREIFADRAYTDSGSLVPRSQANAVLESTEACIAHVRSMIKAGGIVTETGKVLPCDFHSVCVHGDNAHSVLTAKMLRQALLSDGHGLMALPELV